MKKATAIVLALVMLLALCACGGSTSTTPSAAPATAAPATGAPEATADTATTPEPAEVTWPTGDVTVYVPADVGAPLDLASRVAADYLAKQTGVNFVVTNDATGGGAKLASMLSGAKPDGSTIMFCGCGQIVSYYNGTWQNNLADESAFSIIGPLIGQKIPSGAVLVTQLDQPFNTWDELVEYVKANPNTLTVALVNGTPHEVRLKLLFNAYGISDMVRWVSCNNADANANVLGGIVDLAMLTETVGPQYVGEGTLKAIVDSNYVRNYADDDLGKVLDDIPFLFEINDNAQDLCVCWPMLIAGPGGMSDELCNYINETFSTIADDPEFAERIKGLGGTNTYQYSSTEDTRTMVQDADAQCASIFEVIS